MHFCCTLALILTLSRFLKCFRVFLKSFRNTKSCRNNLHFLKNKIFTSIKTNLARLKMLMTQCTGTMPLSLSLSLPLPMSLPLPLRLSLPLPLLLPISLHLLLPLCLSLPLLGLSIVSGSYSNHNHK